MKMIKFAGVAAALSIFASVGTTRAAAPNYYEGYGRIAISSDGNKHDNDDMQATMMTLMILAHAELQPATVLYTYADHVWGSERNDLEIMRESAEGGGERFGFDKTRFIAAVEQPEEAYNAMCDEILKSTAKDPLFIIAAGPMHVVGTALERAYEIDKDAMKHVTILSHSEWNDIHADTPAGKNDFRGEEEPHTGWTWAEMNASFGQLVNFNRISDQNGTGPNPYITKDKFSAPSWSKWAWLLDSDNENVRWVYEKGRKNPAGPDYSDAGLAYYLCADLEGARGDENGNPDKLRRWMEQPIRK